MYGDWGWMGMGMLVVALFWVFVVGGSVWLALTLSRRSGGAERSGALQILEERFARGEIDAEEFRSRKQALQGR